VVSLGVRVRNTGLTPSGPTSLTATPGISPSDSNFFSKADVPALAPGESQLIPLILDTSTFNREKNPVLLTVAPVPGEGQKKNNRLEIAVEGHQ